MDNLVSNEHHGEAAHLRWSTFPPPEEPRTRRVAGSGSSDQETMCHHTLVIPLSYSCHTHVMASYSQPSPAPPTLHSAYCHDDNHRNGSSVWTPVDILLTHSNTAAGEQGEASERVEAEQPHI